MEAFEYNANPARVVFGSGSLQKLPEEVKRLQLSAPLLLSTPQQIDQLEMLESILSGNVSSISSFTEATMHTPTHVTDKALAFIKEQGSDSVISIGGGSTIGLGKAISIRTGLPHICIPTTYAGSEMTPILGETADGRKTTRSDAKILPGTVIYDVDLTMTLPAAMSATSGVNAIAHAGMYAFVIFIRLYIGQSRVGLMEHCCHSRGIVCQEHESSHQRPRSRRHKSTSFCSSGNRRRSFVQVSAVVGFVWCLALRHVFGSGGHGAAS